MAFDFAADVAEVLDGDDYALTAGVLAQGATTDSLSLIQGPTQSAVDLGGLLDEETCFLLVEDAQLTNLTRIYPGDTWTATGERAWTVRTVELQANGSLWYLQATRRTGRDA